MTPADELARLIKRAVHHYGHGWCSTSPSAIARYLLDHGVTLQTTEEEASR
jgi:hypothetical protein